jgi:hypothetical protein
MKVYLDDQIDSVRQPPAGWVGVKTAHEVITLLESGEVEAIDLDHDLGDDKIVGNGYQVLLWIEEAVATRGFVPPADIILHTANQAVYPKMLPAIDNIKRLAAENERGREKAMRQGDNNGR